jgi:hypothetical protein
MLFHIPPRAARSGPMLPAQAPTAAPGRPRRRRILRHEEAADRMHRRDHAQLAEARDVGEIDGLDVLDAVAASARRHRIHRRRALEAVEHHAHGAVAEAVHHDLPAAAVEHRDDAVEVFAAVVGGAGGRRVHVRRDHERGIGLDHPVHEHLHDPGLEQRRVGMRFPDRVEPVGVTGAEFRGDEQRVVDARMQLAGAAQLVVDLEVLRGTGGVGDAGDAERQRLVDGRLQGAALVGAARLRNQPGHQ